MKSSRRHLPMRGCRRTARRWSSHADLASPPLCSHSLSTDSRSRRALMQVPMQVLIQVSCQVLAPSSRAKSSCQVSCQVLVPSLVTSPIQVSPRASDPFRTHLLRTHVCCHSNYVCCHSSHTCITRAFFSSKSACPKSVCPKSRLLKKPPAQEASSPSTSSRIRLFFLSPIRPSPSPGGAL